MSKYKLNQISEHVYWLSPDETTDRPVLGAIVGEKETLVVDAGNSPAHAQLFLNELDKHDIDHPSYVALTHWHWDHIFGAEAFNSLFFASQKTASIVAEMATWDWGDAALDKRVEDGIEIEFCRNMIKKEMPDRSSLKLKSANIAFTNQLDIDLGGLTCQLIYVGGDHASDSIIVYIPQDKVLFLSDCLYGDLYSDAYNYTTEKLFPMLDKIQSLDVDYYLWGHHEEPMPAEEMHNYTNNLKIIGRKVDELGHEREGILADLQNLLNRPLDEDDVNNVDAFIAGLSKS